MEDNYVDPLFTDDQIIQQLSRFTAEQRSLAWSPQPPFESTGAGDCRVGGNCGLDFNRETARARWRQARYRWSSSEQKILQARKRQESGTLKNRAILINTILLTEGRLPACRCALCAARRASRLTQALHMKYSPASRLSIE